jgi:hypothetical protein
VKGDITDASLRSVPSKSKKMRSIECFIVL